MGRKGHHNDVAVPKTELEANHAASTGLTPWGLTTYFCKACRTHHTGSKSLKEHWAGTKHPKKVARPRFGEVEEPASQEVVKVAVAQEAAEEEEDPKSKVRGRGAMVCTRCCERHSEGECVGLARKVSKK